MIIAGVVVLNFQFENLNAELKSLADTGEMAGPCSLRAPSSPANSTVSSLRTWILKKDGTRGVAAGQRAAPRPDLNHRPAADDSTLTPHSHAHFPANFSEDLTDSLSGLGLTGGNDSLASGVQDFATTITDAGKQLLGGLTDAIQG